MKRVALIGLGTISKFYERGLKNSSPLKLVATVDLSKDATAREAFSGYPFYTEYQKAYETQKFDYALIATPPHTHFEIAKYFLEKGVSVIVEKPAVLNLQEYDFLASLAKEKGAYFTVMFHWQYANEIEGYLSLFQNEPIEEIKIKICDNYGVGGIIRDEKRGLNGAWLDSGVNALSVLAKLLPFVDAQILSAESKACQESGLPLYCAVRLKMDGIPVEIVVDWREDTDQKDSWLKVEGKTVWVNHTQERVLFDGKTYDFAEMQRLESHYYNYFTRFKEGETQKGRRIHEVLFAVNERLR